MIGSRASSIAAVAVFLVACASPGYRGGARSIPRVEIEQEWTAVRSLPPRPQRSVNDCGAAAAASVLAYWGVRTSVGQIDRALRAADGDGIRAGDLRDYLRQRGVRAYLVAGTIEDLVHEVERGRPVIIGTLKRYGKRDALKHYEVVVAVRDGGRMIASYDPAAGWRRYSREDLLAEWKPTGQLALVVLPPAD
ncbi:MAG TPA: cysteine peptidase family C39 domain-containing protein [Kofleriaceae bacterium]|nr:cysteine peptidase family C39 domain-containing protein [Kofleriaceae bacterium]